MNFQFDLPQNWYRIDTIMQGAKLCFLMGDNVDGLKPGLNILTEHMHGKEHADYFQGTKQYLIFHNSDIKMVEEGVIDISGTKALWYRFNQIRNGVNRQTVYYSIPVNGISYNITAAVTADGMKKYRPVFDQIVKTFRLIKE